MPLTRLFPGRKAVDGRPVLARPTHGEASVSVVALESPPSPSQTVTSSERGVLVTSGGAVTVIVRAGPAHYRCRLLRAFERAAGGTTYALEVEEPCDVSPPFASTPALPLDEPSLHAALRHAMRDTMAAVHDRGQPGGIEPVRPTPP